MSIPKLCGASPSDQQCQMIYNWIDTITLSRPKRNIARDFSDGVLLAEVIASYHPTLVEMHNYTGANSLSQKMYNWDTLNFKVFKKLGIQFHQQDLEDCCNYVPGSIEKILFRVQKQLSKPSLPLISAPLKPTPRRPATSETKPLTMDELTKLVQEQDCSMCEMKRKLEILTEKCSKLEQLIKLKDKKISVLTKT